jgi:hypothetical protein
MTHIERITSQKHDGGQAMVHSNNPAGDDPHKRPREHASLPFIVGCLYMLIFFLAFSGCNGDGTQSSDVLTASPGFTGGETNPVCVAGNSGEDVQHPEFVRNIPGQTGWYASPVVVDLNNDHAKEVVAAYYTLYVYDAQGKVLDSADGNGKRIYAPHVVMDIDGDGILEIACGQGHEVYVYEWRNGLALKSGWPFKTSTENEPPEIRGMAAADLDGNGSTEIVVTTTETKKSDAGGTQVYVLNGAGDLYQPADTSFQAWPRYNSRTGQGGDADRNGVGHNGYGCYGLNVGIGNIDDDPQQEIIVTYDNHHIQAFNHDGQAIDASDYFKNRDSEYRDMRLTWGQFIRWADPDVEEAHYHLHQGDWPHPGSQEWLQWTASPPNVVDIDGDGRNEVVGIPNIEMEEDTYVTQAYGVMVLEGAYGDGKRSARRLPNWEILPRGDWPIQVAGWYPPKGVPAPMTINIQGDDLPEIVVSLNDGCMYAFDAYGHLLWRHNYTHGKPIMYASEPTAADLNQDGSPEVIFVTYGDPDTNDSGWLIILAADGTLLHDVALPNPGHNGNGNGAPCAPTISDLDGDGSLEILVQTFDHGMDIFTVPGSGDGCLLWTTARGGPLRSGRPIRN